MRYLILGPLEVHDGPRSVALGQGRVRLLLAVLAIHANEVLASERLIDALWGETPPARAAGSLHNLIASLRKTLGDGQLVTRGHGYVLLADDLDAAEFEQLAARGRAALADGAFAEASTQLAEALALWRGPAFADLAYEDAVAAVAARLEELRLATLEDRLDADLALGRHATLVPELAELVERDPARERLRGQLMVALYRCDRQAEALAVYHDYRRRLAGELGLAPAPTLRALEQAILERDPTLAGPASAPDRAPQPRPAAPQRRWRAFTFAAAAVVAVIAAVALQARDAPRAAPVRVVGDALAVIDPGTNRLVASYPVGTTPTSVSVGGGAAWTVSGDAQTVSRIDLRDRSTRTFATGSIPLEVAAGSDALWLVAAAGAEAAGPFGGAPAQLQRIDPRAATVVASTPIVPASGPVTRAPPGLIALSADAVWMIARDGQLLRVDRGSGATTRVRGFRAFFVAAGGGQVWATTESRLLRLDPRTGHVLARLTVPWASLGGLAVGAGAVWLTDPYAGVLWRVDPGPRAVVTTVAVDFGVDSVAADARRVWVANSVTGNVSRIDPAANRVVATIALGATPRSLALGAGRVWVAVAGGERAVAGAPAARVGIAGCGPPLSARGSSPNLLVVADLPTQGRFSSTVRPMAAAIVSVMRAHGFRAGRFRLAVQTCDDSIAQAGGQPDAGKCRANARAYAGNPHVIGVIGPVNSFCAEAMLPALNRAAIALVSPTNSDVDLVRPAPGTPAGFLRKLYPAGQHGYARVYPADDMLMEAMAIAAKQMGATSVYHLAARGDGFPREFFRDGARRIGLPVAAYGTWNPNGKQFADVARRVRASGAQAVVVDGSAYNGIGPVIRALRRELGPGVPLLLTRNALPVTSLFDEVGSAARGLYVMTSGLMPQSVDASGRRFVRTFGATQPGGRVSQYDVYAAAATEVMLDAIARSDGTRASVAHALASTQLTGSPIGPITLGRRGEPTVATATLVRAEHGGAPAYIDGIDGATIVRTITVPAGTS